MGIQIVGAVTGYGSAVAAIPALLLWPETASTAFFVVSVTLLSVSFTLWVVYKGWVR